MIIRALRWLSSLDRSYFFALSAFIAAIVISVTVVLAPLATTADGNEVSLVERDGAIVIFLLVLPVLVVGSPLIALPRYPGPRERSHKINSISTTVVLLAFVVISLPSFGLFYTPALIFSVASSVSLFFGRDRRAARAAAGGVSYEAGGDGVRMSRSARRRLREQERIAAEGSASSQPEESPLSSSRRRRGRNRRKR